ncbi:MAG: def [Anaerolineales bacterium]|nr:def [Anaerolineales bacterium]
MSLRPILTTEDPRLRQRAHAVDRLTDDLQTLIDDMVETMRAAPGVGLAATQLGVRQRVIVVEHAPEPVEGADDEEKAPAKLYVVVNPEITRRSMETVTAAEGCLSIPGYMGDVERHASVSVAGLNRRGKPFRLRARGWTARIFQHEIDHLDGVLFIDRAERVWRPEASDELAPQG